MGLFCWALFSCCASAYEAGLLRQNPQDSFLSQLDEAALKLKFANDICSGTAVAEDVILTAAHCASSNSLSFVDDKPVVTLETITDSRDHILIRVDGVKFKRWAKIGPPLTQAEHIRWIGAPADVEDAYREGYIVKSNKEQILIDGPSFYGDSGAGLFDKQDRLRGVFTGIVVWGDMGAAYLQFGRAFPLEFTPEQLKKMLDKP